MELALPKVETYRSSLLNIPGPPSTDWLLGNLKETYNSDGEGMYDEWVERYGRTFMYRGFFNVCVTFRPPDASVC